MPFSKHMSVGQMMHEMKEKGSRKRSRKQKLAIALSVKKGK